MLAVRRPEQSDRQTDGHAHSHSSAIAGVMPTTIDFQDVVSNFQHDAMHASETFSALYAGEEVSIENAETKARLPSAGEAVVASGSPIGFDTSAEVT